MSVVSATSIGRRHQVSGHLMLYLPVIVIAVLATAVMTKRSPKIATWIGVAAVAAAVVALTVAEVTGNLLLFYLAALASPFGVLVLVVRFAGAVRHRGGAQL